VLIGGAEDQALLRAFADRQPTAHLTRRLPVPQDFTAVGSYSPANSLASVVFPDRLLARAGLYADL
jgi:hypothetical protein